jgi:protein-S-isoprenylcysteine O-methyltransferase Ste14
VAPFGVPATAAGLLESWWQISQQVGWSIMKDTKATKVMSNGFWSASVHGLI